MAGNSKGCTGHGWQATCLPLFFWTRPDCAWVKDVLGSWGGGSVSRWWLLSGFGSGGDGSGLVLVMGVGTSVWSPLGRGGQGVWFM